MSRLSLEGNNASTWQGRPILGRVLQVVLFVVPFITAIIVTAGLSELLPTVDTQTGQILRILFLIVVSIVVMTATERVARLASPVALLLRMTMVFPDHAPSRVRVALRSSSEDELRRTLAEVDRNGLGATANEAAETLMVLVAALGQHDRLTKGHSERTRAYADVIAAELGMPSDDRARLRWAALLHDVGKMQIPAEILNKPSRLTDTEYEIIKQHPLIGANLVEPLREFLGPFADTVAEHHERWDGTGYPYGLKGREINYGARVVAVADTFDVITSLRSYKKPSSSAQAREEIARNAGTQFDPEVVKAFLAISLGRFRWMHGPLSLLTQIPQVVSFLSPVAGTVTTVASATPAAAAGVATLGFVAVSVDPPAPSLLPVSEEAAIVVEDEPEDAVGPGTVITTSVDPSITVTVPTTIDRSGEASTASTTEVGGPSTSERPEVSPSSTSSPNTSSPNNSVSTRPTTSTTVPSTTTRPPSVSTSRPTTTPSTTTTAPTTVVVPPTTTTTAPTTTTAAVGNPPDGVLPQVIGRCLDDPGITAAELRNAGGPVDFDGCVLGEDGPLNLSGFNLSDVHIHGGDWSGTNFTNTNLNGAQFHELAMAGANFEGADVRDIDFRNYNLVGSNFGGADLSGARFRDGDARNSNFFGTTIDDAVFERSNLSGSTFASALLNDVDAEDLGADGVSFANTTLVDIDLTGATLTGADFRNSDMTDIKVEKALIDGARFEGADMVKVDLKDATGTATLGTNGDWDDSTCPDDTKPSERVCTWQ